MISMIQPVAAGNALRVFLEPPSGALRWRLLRKLGDTFTGEDDTDAIVIYNGDDKPILDTLGLVNSTLYYYRPYYFDGTTWTPGTTVTSTPAATFEDLTVDVLSLVRERLDLGLQVEIARGNLIHDDSHIQVLTAPPTTDQARWPIVTVHLHDESAAERGIGEIIGADEFDAETDEWLEKEGWLARTQLSIMGWSLNPDERIELRKALRRILLANFPIFDFAGMIQIDFSQQDTEDFESFGAPVYQVLCTLSCLAPSQVGFRVHEVITDVTLQNGSDL